MNTIEKLKKPSLNIFKSQVKKWFRIIFQFFAIIFWFFLNILLFFPHVVIYAILYGILSLFYNMNDRDINNFQYKLSPFYSWDSLRNYVNSCDKEPF